MVNDPYQVLGVSPNADEDTIRQAYRRLAKKYHPDLNPGDAAAAQKMNEINEAYDLIKNPQAYQQQRAQQQAQQQARQAYQRQQQQGYYDPFDPFGFYRQDGQNSQNAQNGAQNGNGSSGPQYHTYYYYSGDDDPSRQQYQWTYHRPRRSTLGILGKILVAYFIFQIFFSLFGGCSALWNPYYYYYDYSTPESGYSQTAPSYDSTTTTPEQSYSGFGRG